MPTITLARGDGIGPEITESALFVLKETGAPLEFEEIEVGLKVYERGITAGIEPSAWESLQRTGVLLKAPVTTPQGQGMKSLNVTLRKTLGLYANVRPCSSYHPVIQTRHPGMDIVIVRENEEDLYAGIEYRQTAEVLQCLKLISFPGSERIVRYGFEYARANGRKKVSCFTKDNIMKMTDGVFHRVFEEIGAEYPDIERDHWIIDIGTALVADAPEKFDVIVTPNLYGDILSDVAAQITGSVGLGGSANVGKHSAMFEAVHGSAPTIAGLNIANPSGILLASVMMLVHLGLPETAEAVHNAWLKTIEDGIHTLDIFREGTSCQRAGTQDFGKAVAERLGQTPATLQPVQYQKQSPLPSAKEFLPPAVSRQLTGVDIFFNVPDKDTAVLAEKLQSIPSSPFALKTISNRGLKVWPEGNSEAFCTDLFGSRWLAKGECNHADVVQLLSRLEKTGLDFVKTELLFRFDDEPGFTRGQGE